MARQYKVFDSGNEYIASFRYLSDAVRFLTQAGEGHDLRYGRFTLWREGREVESGYESIDAVMDIIEARIVELNHARRRRDKSQVGCGVQVSKNSPFLTRF